MTDTRVKNMAFKLFMAGTAILLLCCGFSVVSILSGEDVICVQDSFLQTSLNGDFHKIESENNEVNNENYATASATESLSAPQIYWKSGAIATVCWHAVDNADGYTVGVASGASAFNIRTNATEYKLDDVIKSVAGEYFVTVTATDSELIYNESTSNVLSKTAYTLYATYDSGASSLIVIEGDKYLSCLDQLDAGKAYHDLSWQFDDSDMIEEGDLIVSDKLAVKAVYAPATYKITYLTNGGTPVTEDTGIYTYGSEKKLQAFGSTKTGYQFAGWCENEDLSDATYKLTAGTHGDKVLYAKWVISDFTLNILYDDMDGVEEYEGESRTKEYNGYGFTITVGVIGGEGSQVVYTYVWYKGGTSAENVIDGANKRSYTTGANVSDSGNYYVQVIAENKLDSTDSKQRTSAVYVFTITKKMPVISSFGTASTGVYGNTLSDVRLSGCVADVDGAFAFENPSTVLSVGTKNYGVQFTPLDTVNYDIVKGDVSVAVRKATPVVTSFGAATNGTYGDILSDIILSGGMANVDGSFAFASPATALPVGIALYSVRFIPSDQENYNSVLGDVVVSVAPRTLQISWDAMPEVIVEDGETIFSTNATATNVVGSDEVQLVLADNSTKVAGRYTAKIVGILPQDGKYVLPSQGLTFNYTVLRRTVQTASDILPVVTVESSSGFAPECVLEIAEKHIENFPISQGKQLMGAYALTLSDGATAITPTDGVTLKFKLEGALGNMTGIEIFTLVGTNYTKLDCSIENGYLVLNQASIGEYLISADASDVEKVRGFVWLIVLLVIVNFLEIMSILYIMKRRTDIRKRRKVKTLSVAVFPILLSAASAINQSEYIAIIVLACGAIVNSMALIIIAFNMLKEWLSAGKTDSAEILRDINEKTDEQISADGKEEIKGIELLGDNVESENIDECDGENVILSDECGSKTDSRNKSTSGECGEAEEIFTRDGVKYASADVVLSTAESNRVRKTFMDKLNEQEDEVMAYYVALRDEIMSYANVKSRISFSGNSFRVKRVNVARLTIDGKTLRLHLPLDPDAEEYNDGKYPHKNLSMYESYADIPFMIKIKSGLAVRRAVKLIAVAMDKLGYTK